MIISVWVKLTSYLYFRPRIQNSFIHVSVLAVIIFAIAFIPFVSAEESEKNHIALSSEEIKKPESSTGIESLTVKGNIPSYDRGNYIHLVCVFPSGESKEFITFGSKDGDYFTTINIGKEYEKGQYQLLLNYQGEQISSVSFKII
ncbi:MAG: hypothetical protein GWN01_16685 [Nitrosopumilaceae archaeon]|nr:hypothetical protein [Nitrosopumilaceae archaeon]NIV67042.1 hypothetical protein [Nitrosopumilaceae archaeon]NIX63071.1 hypothetical protein [Nitrosopumilaceae archaeon]